MSVNTYSAVHCSMPCHPLSSCGESFLKPGGCGGHAAPAPEAALHPRPHHGPRCLRHHVLFGDHCHRQNHHHIQHAHYI